MAMMVPDLEWHAAHVLTWCYLPLVAYLQALDLAWYQDLTTTSRGWRVITAETLLRPVNTEPVS